MDTIIGFIPSALSLGKLKCKPMEKMRSKTPSSAMALTDSGIRLMYPATPSKFIKKPPKI